MRRKKLTVRNSDDRAVMIQTLTFVTKQNYLEYHQLHSVIINVVCLAEILTNMCFFLSLDRIILAGIITASVSNLTSLYRILQMRWDSPVLSTLGPPSVQ